MSEEREAAVSREREENADREGHETEAHKNITENTCKHTHVETAVVLL